MTSSPVESSVSPPCKTRSYSIDDSNVDYLSLLGLEDRKRRFSEVLVDTELKETMMLQKQYRQIQRQVHCQQSKAVWGLIIMNKYYFWIQFQFLSAHLFSIKIIIELKHLNIKKK